MFVPGVRGWSRRRFETTYRAHRAWERLRRQLGVEAAVRPLRRAPDGL